MHKLKSFIAILLCQLSLIPAASACIGHRGCWFEVRTNGLLILGTYHKIDSPALISFYAGYWDVIIAFYCLAAILLTCCGIWVYNRIHKQKTTLKSLPYKIIVPLGCIMLLALMFHAAFVPLNELKQICDANDCL